MKKMLLILLSVVFITACKKEITQSQPKEEEVGSVAAKASDKITIWHYNATNNTWKQTSINANAWSEHQAHGDIWKVGQNYKGGKIGYILQAGDPGYDANVPHGLIAAEADLYNPYLEQPKYQWSIYMAGDGLPEIYFGIGEPARGTAIGTGSSNTTAIVQYLTGAIGWMNSTYPGYNRPLDQFAAVACRKEFNGYNDWFLPSRDELQKVLQNRVAIGGFPEANSSPYPIAYWSSTELFSDSEYIRVFMCSYGSGTAPGQVVTNYNTSPESLRVRPVRYF